MKAKLQTIIIALIAGIAGGAIFSVADDYFAKSSDADQKGGFYFSGWVKGKDCADHVIERTYVVRCLYMNWP